MVGDGPWLTGETAYIVHLCRFVFAAHQTRDSNFVAAFQSTAVLVSASLEYATLLLPYILVV